MYIHMVIIGVKKKKKSCLSGELVLDEVGTRNDSLEKLSLHLSIEPLEGSCRWRAHTKLAAVPILSTRGPDASRAAFLLLGPASQTLTNWEETGWNQVNKYNSGFIKNQEFPCCALLALKK